MYKNLSENSYITYVWGSWWGGGQVHCWSYACKICTFWTTTYQDM